MTERSGFEQFKQITDCFTSKGCLSFKKLFNFVFPSKEENSVDNFGSKWRKVISYVAPIAAILILLSIFFVGYLWGKTYEAGLILFGLHFLICLIGVLYLGVLFLFSIILKLKKRSPTVLLGLTLVFPLRALLFLGVINAIFFVFIAYPGPSSDTKRLKKHPKQYERLFSSNEKNRSEMSESELGASKLLSSQAEESSDQRTAEELFQQFSEKSKHDKEQMQERFFKSVEEKRQENTKKKVDFGKHCILLGKMGENSPDSVEETNAHEEETKASDLCNLPGAPTAFLQRESLLNELDNQK